jgi:hypothetical protein
MDVVGQITGWSQLRGADAEGRQKLAHWTEGSGIDAVLAAAVRFADQTQQDYAAYHSAYRAGKKR